MDDKIGSHATVNQGRSKMLVLDVSSMYWACYALESINGE